jgi:hypothetical protein
MIKKIAGIAATSFLSGCAMVGINYGTEYTGHYTPRGTYYHEAGKTITRKQEIYPGDVMATISVIKAHTKLTSTSDCYIEWRRDGHSFINISGADRRICPRGPLSKKGTDTTLFQPCHPMTKRINMRQEIMQYLIIITDMVPTGGRIPSMP